MEARRLASQTIVSVVAVAWAVLVTTGHTWPTLPPSAPVPLRPTVRVTVQTVPGVVEPQANVALAAVGLVMFAFGQLLVHCSV